MSSALEQVRGLQDCVGSARAEADVANRQALDEFQKLKANLTMDELMELAEECGAEVGPRHCVCCAAWHEYIARGGDN